MVSPGVGCGDASVGHAGSGPANASLLESSEDVTSARLPQLPAAAASGGQMKPRPALGDLRCLKCSLNSCDGVTNIHMLVGPRVFGSMGPW